MNTFLCNMLDYNCHKSLRTLQIPFHASKFAAKQDIPHYNIISKENIIIVPLNTYSVLTMCGQWIPQLNFKVITHPSFTVYWHSPLHYDTQEKLLM